MGRDHSGILNPAHIQLRFQPPRRSAQGVGGPILAVRWSSCPRGQGWHLGGQSGDSVWREMGLEFSFHVFLEVLPRVPGSGRSLDQDDSAAFTCKVAEVCTLGKPHGAWLNLPHSVQPTLFGNHFPPAPMPGPLFTYATKPRCQLPAWTCLSPELSFICLPSLTPTDG